MAIENRAPVSVVMISGPEATRIGSALESVSSWASEIIVLLNEDVADGTAEIAAKHGARVFREPWKGFIGQKNSASTRATQPWLLNLDADEVVPPELARQIIEATSQSGNHGAYEFPRCTFYCGRWIRHGDWYPDRVLRLWKRESAQWAGEEPHAKLKVNGSIGRLRADLHHFTNESIEHQIRKIVPYSQGFVDHARANNHVPGLFTLVFRPFWRFLRGYVFKLGFLDGWQGCYIAWVNAFSVATKYARAREPRSAKPQ